MAFTVPPTHAALRVCSRTGVHRGNASGQYTRTLHGGNLCQLPLRFSLRPNNPAAPAVSCARPCGLPDRWSVRTNARTGAHLRRPLRISTLSLWLVASACGVGTPVCGDGIVSGAETCDDGNLENGDDCTEHCLQPICGDGLLSRGEDCDDGNKNDQDACTSNCLLAYCGDGIQRIDLTRDETGYEACDSPNSATCTDECLRPTLLWNRVMMGGGDSSDNLCL